MFRTSSGVGLGPARRGIVLHGDGKLGVSLAYAANSSRELPSASCDWPDENIPLPPVHCEWPDRWLASRLERALRRLARRFRVRSGSLGDIAAWPDIRNKVRSEAGCAPTARKSHGPAQGIFVEPVGGSASGAAIDYGPYRNSDSMFRNILVDSVVRETRQSIIVPRNELRFHTLRAALPRRNTASMTFFSSAADESAPADPLFELFFILSAPKRPCPSSRSENARAPLHGPCPWFA
jgi:hypothetical protein